MAYEVATAYVSIVPSMKGIQRSIAEELGGVDRQATKSAGLISRTVGKAEGRQDWCSVNRGMAAGATVWPLRWFVVPSRLRGRRRSLRA